MLHNFRAKTTLAVLVFTVLLSGLNLVWAAAPPPLPTDDSRNEIEAQNRRVRQEEQDRRQRELSPDVFLQKGKQGAVTTKLPDETPSFAIQTILLEGDEAERYPWIQDIVQQYAGQKVGRQGINIIVKALTEALIDRGYITTRVLIPEQDLSGGHSYIAAHSGRYQGHSGDRQQPGRLAERLSGPDGRYPQPA